MNIILELLGKYLKSDETVLDQKTLSEISKKIQDIPSENFFKDKVYNVIITDIKSRGYEMSSFPKLLDFKASVDTGDLNDIWKQIEEELKNKN
ncbi:hypothetical protein GTQ34_13910 [Muricauda sp. JGD-17]|uniref:Uncharacterized protein n=1 Tax=Flagellimonas ochracea TaxID=2696472 RepID=A0A964TDP8_9FLAO|nr:hypothetical protein [Allomuricauda ochracea]NAY93015.1 hypothetical protein [Allomuricauda ochracea]